MYRSASRYESRSIPEKPSRSARSAWVEPQQNHPYVPALEDEDRGILRNPYLTDDAHVSDRDFQHSKGTSGGTDLREAQRLAASFFSQYPSASTGPPPLYRDAARSSRPLSPEAPMERYSARGQYRDRDLGLERWADRSNPEALFPPSRSQLVLEDWEEDRIPVDSRRERMDLYGVSAARGRKRDDGGWDDTDYDYGVGRKETDYIHPSADIDGGLRVTKRVDWTGLLRPDGSRTEDGIGLDSSLGKRPTGQDYRGGGRPFVDSYRNSLEDELDPEGPLYSRRAGGYYGSERYRESDVGKERGYLDERLPAREEYVLDRGLGSRGGGRGTRGRGEWRTDRGTSAGRGHRLSDSERGRDKSRYEDRDSRRPFYSSSRYSAGGSGSGADRDRDVADEYPPFGKGRGGRRGAVKRDFSQRASITNQDILAVYYGNQGPACQSNKFIPRRSFPYSRYHDDSGPPRYEKYRPRRPSGSPLHGRPIRYNPDFDPSRKGKKRWEKPVAEGSEGKRFKRETQSDKLYLMHNSKATTEEKEDESAGNLAVAERETEETELKEETNKGEASEPPAEDAHAQMTEDTHVQETEDTHVQRTVDTAVEKNDPPEPTSGLWDNDDSWSDSEEEEEKEAQLTWDGPSTNEGSTWGQATGEERERATFQALQSGAVNDSKKFLGECSEDDEDDDADWESLASDLDDQLDDVCVHQGLEDADAVTENPDSKGVVPTKTEAQASEENGRVGTQSVAQSQDSEMVDVDNVERSEGGKEVPDVDNSVEEVGEGVEKRKVVVIMEELQESVKNREDKAFDYYVSLFEQDTDLMKLYEANVSWGSFECLVCAGVGDKKKKRFPDVASLVQHAKKILKTKKLPEHRGFARAVCKLLGWETVPGPSIILPRGCIPPQQSEPNVLTSGASQKEEGGTGNVAGMDWEWAAARRLFEEQEARINVASRSPVELLQTESMNAGGRSLLIEGNNTDSHHKAGNLATVVETIVTVEKPTGGNHVLAKEKATAEALWVQEKVTPIDVVSKPDKVSVIEMVSGVEKATVEDIAGPGKATVKEIPLSEIFTVVESISVSEKIAGCEVSGSRSMRELTSIASKGVKDISCSPPKLLTGETEGAAVEMGASLPQDGADRVDPTQITVARATRGFEEGM